MFSAHTSARVLSEYPMLGIPAALKSAPRGAKQRESGTSSGMTPYEPTLMSLSVRPRLLGGRLHTPLRLGLHPPQIELAIAQLLTIRLRSLTIRHLVSSPEFSLVQPSRFQE